MCCGSQDGCSSVVGLSPAPGKDQPAPLDLLSATLRADAVRAPGTGVDRARARRVAQGSAGMARPPMTWYCTASSSIPSSRASSAGRAASVVEPSQALTSSSCVCPASLLAPPVLPLPRSWGDRRHDRHLPRAPARSRLFAARRRASTGGSSSPSGGRGRWRVAGGDSTLAGRWLGQGVFGVAVPWTPVLLPFAILAGIAVALLGSAPPVLRTVRLDSARVLKRAAA